MFSVCDTRVGDPVLMAAAEETQDSVDSDFEDLEIPEEDTRDNGSISKGIFHILIAMLSTKCREI